jgi:formate dehydrogenase accessory protein FdhD
MEKREKITKLLRIFKWEKGESTIFADMLARESLIRIYSDEMSFEATITPTYIKSFVYGHLFSEGFINSLDNVKNYRKELRDSTILVSIDLQGHMGEHPFPQEKVILGKHLQVNPIALTMMPKKIKDKMKYFEETGAFHYAFLLDKDLELQNYAYDVGRYNTIDKVIGIEVLKGKMLEGDILFITGRITTGIVKKCIRSKIQLLASKGAVSYDAALLARKCGLGVVGFLREERFNVYNGIEMFA